LLGPSGRSMGSIRDQALSLLGRVLEGFELHPFFYVLNLNVRANVDPPVTPYAHQVELLFRLAFRSPLRILVGDEIGLGKTVEAILAVKLLERRGGARRVLILVPRILVEQWVSELKRFGIQARVIERRNFDSLAMQGFPGGWYVASIDLVKRRDYVRQIASVGWDVIIVDEAHRVGRLRPGGPLTQRYELVKALAADPGRSLILLSATPHRGHPEDYISRLKLIDPYLEGSEKELDSDQFYRLTRDSIVVRRTKVDVNEVYEKKEVFKNARFVAKVIEASREEEEFNRLLFEFLREKLLTYYELVGEEPKALPLLLALIAKRASSSPYAAMKTLERMLTWRAKVVRGILPPAGGAGLDEKELDKEAGRIVEAYLGLGFEDYSEAEDQEGAVEPDDPVNAFVEKCVGLLEGQDIDTIQRLFNLAKAIVERGDSRLRGVFRLVKEHIERGDRVVVFTEYRDTAEYIYSRLKGEMPEIAEKAALVTSERVAARGKRLELRGGIEELKKLLRRGEVGLVISTDVASEGLNLQEANIIINYEPTWSPVKVEQRLGRVWRLGQKSDVTSYTLFLAVQSDKDILDVLYKKLLAWGRSLQTHRVAIGEEVVIEMLGEGGSTAIPIDVGAVEGAPKYSEYKAILTYIGAGRSGLDRYVTSIVSALVSLKRSLERAGLARRDVSLKVDRILDDVLGGFRGAEVERALRELFITAAKLAGLTVKDDGDRVYAGGFIVEDICGFYSGASTLAQGASVPAKPLYILSSAQLGGLKELHLFKVEVLLDDKPVYSEVVGVGVRDDRVEVVRGRRLLEVLSSALQPDYLWSAVHEYAMPAELQRSIGARAESDVMDRVAREAISEMARYMDTLEKQGFSGQHEHWRPRGIGEFSGRIEHLGAIIFITPPETGVKQPPPPSMVKEVEGAAMRIAMEYEERSGRVPEDVSGREHYDIFSRDPGSGEVRFIEVKGKSGLDLDVELTEAEFEVAKEKGERYWLYIVYGIGTGRPRLLAVRDPVNNVRWSEILVRRYRLTPG